MPPLFCFPSSPTSVTARPRSPHGIGLLWGLLALGLLVGSACSKKSPRSERTSALLITFDTTRFDALESFGGLEGLTPHIDALAEAGVAFDQAYSVTPMTQPAHASMMTGLYPPRHGVRINGHGPLPQSAQTLAELAGAAGYETAAFVSAVVLDSAFGLDQGFEVYDVPRRGQAGGSGGYASRNAGAVVDAALSWFEGRDPSRAFFVWVHVWDPHPPWDPKPEFFGPAQGNPYLAAVAEADAELGRLLNTLEEDGTLDNTVVLLVSDHGEAFGEHGESSHSSHCYQSTIHVPMILCYPDRFGAGTRIDTVVSVADVQPTLAEAMDLRPAADLDGRSLYRVTHPEERGAYIESYYGYMCFSWSPLSGWVGSEGKYLHSSRPEFYDVHADPSESQELFEQRREVAARYADRIAAVFARETLEADSAGPGIDESLRAELEQVGYASSGLGDEALPHPLAPSDLPSPRDGMEERTLTLAVLDMLKAGDYARAEEACRRILATNPGNAWALDRLAASLLRQKRLPEAVAPLRKIVQSGRATVFTYCNLGGSLRALGQTEEALRYFELALELDPNEPLSLSNAAELLERAGRSEEAASLRRRLAEVQGNAAEAP